jgi:hypothetical protein
MRRTLARVLLGYDPVPEGPAAAPVAPTRAETVLFLIAGLSFVAGVIHIGASIDHAQEFLLYTPVFALFAAFQIGWALLVTRRCSRRVLVLGIALNAAIVLLWVASRTVGVPIAPVPWGPEPVGAADLLAAVAESAIVLGTACVLRSPGSRFAQRALAWLAPVLLGVLFLSVMYGVTGGHAG